MVSLVAAPLLVGGHVIGVVQVAPGRSTGSIPGPPAAAAGGRPVGRVHRAGPAGRGRPAEPAGGRARPAPPVASWPWPVTNWPPPSSPTTTPGPAGRGDRAHLRRLVRRRPGPLRRGAAGGLRGPGADHGGLVGPTVIPQGDDLVHLAMAKGRPEVVMNTQDRGPADEPPGRELRRGGARRGGRVHADRAHPGAGLSFGALSFVTGSGRRGYRRSDLETAQGLAERVAVAIERVLVWGRAGRPSGPRPATPIALRRLMEAALAVNAPLAESPRSSGWWPTTPDGPRGRAAA